MFKERTCLYSVGTEGSVQFLRLCSLQQNNATYQLCLSPLLCLQSLCRFFFFPKVVHFINVYLSAVLHCQPCSETATTNKKLLCCRGLCIECFEKLEREEERDAPSTVQSQVLHVKHYKYEAEQNSLRMKRFWFSTHGSHHVSFRVINGH